MKFQEVSKFNDIKLNNVCIYIYDISKCKILTVNEKNNKLGVPAGKLLKNEICWNGIKREFKEETGRNIPVINIIKRYIINHHDKNKTGMYIATIKCDVNDYKNWKTKEILKVEYKNIKEIKRSKMRNSMKKSFPYVENVIENDIKIKDCIVS